ncbi:molecular chaperone DnaJ [Photobacterium angustum]|uniref:Molecular chaperone DnaJ n=1 Tax=Photobacterium angustum TaxID=661 RepID=A0ABX5H865_PHOAN|nr:DNA-J related domain-containing protein [Photobacterium angustum]KJG36508.1 molecular chaperone DnaJ [Photobacterium angustum]PSX12311.1 molecular chaperone DnaJ [Photobacterium angustum]
MTNQPIDFQLEHENPLIWPILSLLQHQPKNWMIHTLSQALREKEMLDTLDSDSNKDLFKRNFLLMNALYQLQILLFPKQWLQVQAMDIQLLNIVYQTHHLEQEDPLREYYLDWKNYHADSDAIEQLLSSFWRRYQQHINSQPINITTTSIDDDFDLFSLSNTASLAEVRKQWRRLALQWHPDRENGDGEKFKLLYNANQRLISYLKNR